MRCAWLPAEASSQERVTLDVPAAWYVRFAGAGGPAIARTYLV